MKQKIIALAIAAAFSAPAFADTGNITVYGKAFLTLDQHDAGKTTSTSTTRVNTNASRFGVKGSEDLGDGLKALFQYEVEMDADGSAGTGLGKTRNSGAGLEGGFGKVILGYWDTPLKVAHNAIELFDNTTSWTATTTIGRSAGKNFNTRQKNMVQYWTPKMGGLQASFMYSPDEAKTNTVDKNILSMAGTYKEDGIYASLAYESRSDATTTGTTDSALRAVGKYDLGDFWVGAMLENIKTNLTAASSVTGNNAEVVGAFKMGAASLAASYAKAGSTATGATPANDVDQIALRYGYKFSKRTEAFAAYASKKTNGVGGIATSETANTFGGGLIHSF